jgi:hypothetical protein
MQNGADASSCRRNDQLSGAAQARSPPSDFDALVAVLDKGVLAPRGRLLRALTFTFVGGKIVQIDVIADPARLRQLDLAVLSD